MRPPRIRVATADPSDLLNLGSPLARLLLGVVVLIQIVFAMYSLSVVSDPHLVVIALAVFGIAASVLANPRKGPFSLRLTALVIVAGAAVTALVEVGLPPGSPGYSAWNFGAVTWLAFFLAFRGRIAGAWLLMLVAFLVTLVWAIDVGRGPLEALELISRHVGTLLISTLFRVLLNRGAERISAIRAQRVQQAYAEAAAETEIQERTNQAAQLHADARPLLDEIVRGEYGGADDARRFVLLEASLRDALRGRRLATPEVAAAATAARARGAQVVLLDDRDEDLPAVTAARVLPVIVAELASLSTGRITARLLPAGRDVIATLVRDDESGHRRRDFLAATSGAPVMPALR